MNATYKMIEIAKNNNGMESDYAIANYLGVSKGMVSHWKLGRSEANGENLLRLIKAAGISIDDALSLMDESSEPLRQAGFSTLSMMFVLGASSLGAITLMKMSALPYEALTASFFVAGNCILCKIVFILD